MVSHARTPIRSVTVLSICFLSSQFQAMVLQSTISLSAVLDALDSGQPFNMNYVTASVTRCTGGEIKHRSQWVGCQFDMIPEAVLFKNKGQYTPVTKKQNMLKIRHIMNPRNQEIRSVHIRLICELNGMRVV